jgi:hypothetical protein
MSENKDISKYVDVPTSKWKNWATEKFWKKLNDFNNVRLCKSDLDDIIKDRLNQIIHSQPSVKNSPDNSKVTIHYECMIDMEQWKIKSIADFEKCECIFMMENE